MFGAVGVLGVEEELLAVPQGFDTVNGDGNPEFPSDFNEDKGT